MPETSLRTKLTSGHKIVTEAVKEIDDNKGWGQSRHIKLLYALLFISYRKIFYIAV